MNWFPLPIFPEGSLASSVVTTVWVGVLVFCVMNLRFGWVLSGLVVPGYLVPLLLVKPWAAVVIVLESVLTFWTVLAMTRLMPRFKIACSFFGRDRFMAMIIVSALYRVVGDTWLLPAIGRYLTSHHGIDFDYRNNLHSFGLIVICLAANQLWKTGIVRGAVPFVFNILITYLIVRYVLMVLTNFSISNISFLYEDIATSIYASPKAYIVLITTSILASRMNLLYGWDFNGIMIPALIALQWYEPTKVLTSFVEALVILGVGILVLKLPLFKSMTIEGARKLLLFFSISFLYKMALGWGLLFAAPAAKVSDFYGFGYLLPTLMAIKMHQVGKIIHQLRITLQISIVSIFVASGVGFALTFLPSHAVTDANDRPIMESRRVAESELVFFAKRTFVDSYAGVGAKSAVKPGSEDIYLFEQGLAALSAYAASQSDAGFETTRHKLGAAGFRMDRIGDQFLQVSPVDAASGRPMLILRLLGTGGLTVECPGALDETDSFDNALQLFVDQEARALAVAGAADSEGGPMVGEYGTPRSWFACIDRSWGHGGVIQVRQASGTDATSKLYVKRALPAALNLKKLEEQFGDFTVLWESPGEKNPLRDASVSGFCELFLADGSVARRTRPITIAQTGEPIDSLIRKEFYDYAPKATNLYVPPTAAELLHIDRSILRPLLAVNAGQVEQKLNSIRHHAAFHGYTLTAYRNGDSNPVHVLLKEEAPRRFWGSVLLRIDDQAGGSNEVCLEVPSRVEDRSLVSFAATQFKRLGAKMLIAAGTNSFTNSDGSSVLTEPQNPGSFVNLAHQAFLRSAKSGTAVVIQCRAFLPAPGEPYPDGDIIVSTYQENRSAKQNRAALGPVIDLLKGDGISVSELRVDDETSAYTVGVNPQAKYMDFSTNGAFAILWLSPFLRQSHQLLQPDDPVLKMLKALEMTIRGTPLPDYLNDKIFAPHSAVNEALKIRLRQFRKSADIHVLQHVSAEFSGDKFEAVLDAASHQLFLVCLDPEGRPRLVANLSPHSIERSHDAQSEKPESFIDARAAWLESQPSRPR